MTQQKPHERIADALEKLAELHMRRDREVQAERVREREARRIGSRSELRRLDLLTLARARPEIAAAFSRKIPAEFWGLDDITAMVACPCGGTPSTEKGIPHFCEGEVPGESEPCGRAYLYDGEAVRVAFSPAPEPQTPAAS